MRGQNPVLAGSVQRQSRRSTQGENDMARRTAANGTNGNARQSAARSNDVYKPTEVVIDGHRFRISTAGAVPTDSNKDRIVFVNGARIQPVVNGKTQASMPVALIPVLAGKWETIAKLVDKLEKRASVGKYHVATVKPGKDAPNVDTVVL
jgi:hypothetical protein